jgi:ubiquinone biosynthesis protein COQ9
MRWFWRASAHDARYLMQMTPPDCSDQTEDWAATAEARVLDQAIRLAPALHWNDGLAKAAARAAGLSDADAALLLPNGAKDLAALLFRRHDQAALLALAPLDAPAMKVRAKIQAAVSSRIEAAMADEAATKCAAAYLLVHPALGASLSWATADGLWRWAGDTATDENHYSKRAILSAVLLSTLAARLAGGRAAGEAHLAARIGNVMAFEKWKAGLPTPVGLAREAAGWLGRLRYGA